MEGAIHAHGPRVGGTRGRRFRLTSRLPDAHEARARGISRRAVPGVAAGALLRRRALDRSVYRGPARVPRQPHRVAAAADSPRLPPLGNAAWEERVLADEARP